MIVYIRDYPSHVVSLYNQHTVRGRNTHDIDTMFRCRHNKLQPIVNQWADEFGREAVRYRAFNDLNGRSLTADFAATVGADHIPGLDFLEGVRVRASKNWMAVELARLMAKLSGPNSMSPTVFARALWVLSRVMLGVKQMETSHPVQYLTPQQWMELRDSYNRFIAAITATFPGHSLPLFDGSPPPRPFLPSFETIPAEIKRRLARLESERFKRSHPDVPAELLEAVAQHARDRET